MASLAHNKGNLSRETLNEWESLQISNDNLKKKKKPTRSFDITQKLFLFKQNIFIKCLIELDFFLML